MRRIARLNPPYYVTLLLLLLFITIKVINPQAEGEHLVVSVKKIVLHLFYLVPFFNETWFDNIFWTLAIEFQYYILIALLYPFLIKQNKYLVIVLIVFLCFSHYLPFAKTTLSIANYSTPFLLGITAFLYKINKINNRQMLILSLVLIYLCKSQISGTRMIFGLFALIAILFWKFRSKPTDFLGQISYSLYLTHNLFFILAFSLTEKLIDLKSMVLVNNCFVFIFFVLSIPVAYAYYIAVEKPSIALALKYKPQSKSIS